MTHQLQISHCSVYEIIHDRLHFHSLGKVVSKTIHGTAWALTIWTSVTAFWAGAMRKVNAFLRLIFTRDEMSFILNRRANNSKE